MNSDDKDQAGKAPTRADDQENEGGDEGEGSEAADEGSEAVDEGEGGEAGDEGEGGETGDEGEGTAFQLGGAERRFLTRTARFLIGVQTPGRAKIVRRAGYTAQENALGWSLFGQAAGQDRSFEHFVDQVDESDDVTANAAQMNRLRELDEFENLWFPRARAVIRRVVPADERERFAAAFFMDLEQQPLGPGVITSVAAFLTRIEGLSTSRLKGAAEVRETLRQRGLTDAELSRARHVLGQLREPAVKATPPNEAERLAAQRAQRKAFADLRDWFNDWATTLRTLLPARDRIALGLTTRKRTSSPVEGDEVDEGEGGEGEAEGLLG